MSGDGFSRRYSVVAETRRRWSETMQRRTAAPFRARMRGSISRPRQRSPSSIAPCCTRRIRLTSLWHRPALSCDAWGMVEQTCLARSASLSPYPALKQINPSEDPESPRLCLSRRRDDRQLNIQYRPIGRRRKRQPSPHKQSARPDRARPLLTRRRHQWLSRLHERGHRIETVIPSSH